MLTNCYSNNCGCSNGMDGICRERTVDHDCGCGCNSTNSVNNSGCGCNNSNTINNCGCSQNLLGQALGGATKALYKIINGFDNTLCGCNNCGNSNNDCGC